MTRFTVVWHDDAQNQLAEIWMRAADRAGVNEAVSRIDVELGRDSESKGTSVEGDLRELLISPLRVYYSVSEPDRLVKVLYVSQE